MRILITGAAGLYGVHLVDELVKMEAISRVIGVDNFSRQYCENTGSFPLYSLAVVIREGV